MQDSETPNNLEIADDPSLLKTTGRLVSMDLGTKRIGIAVSDASRTVSRPLERIERTSWKKLLLAVKSIIAEFDAVGLVIGLPLESDGSESTMSKDARRIAANFTLSLDIPVFLQDERVTSYEARSRLWEQGVDLASTRKLVDSEAAVIILDDFIARSSS